MGAVRRANRKPTEKITGEERGTRTLETNCSLAHVIFIFYLVQNYMNTFLLLVLQFTVISYSFIHLFIA